MKNVLEFNTVLQQIFLLLEKEGELVWAKAFHSLSREALSDPESAVLKVKGIFGGMGSFNDLVLHRNGIPTTNENNELQKFRARLFELCYA